MRMVNFTIELESDQEAYDFENWLRQYVPVKDVILLPDTKELYEADSHFRSLTKKYYEARRLRDDYINRKNFKE